MADELPMVQKHPGFVEPDMEAVEAANLAAQYAGENPHPKGTARWMAWENTKRQLAGLPATNDPTGPQPVMVVKNKAYQEVDYKASKSSWGGMNT